MSGPSQFYADPDGALVETAGYPNDGGTYLDIDPMSDTNGQRVVWWLNGHHWGYALSDPVPGAHLPKVQQDGWSADQRLRKMALYWIYAVRDEDLPRHLVGDLSVRMLVPIEFAWLVALPSSQRPA